MTSHMFRSNTLIRWPVGAVAALAAALLPAALAPSAGGSGAAASAAADRAVERYLDRVGARSLLAEQLSRRLTTADPAERLELAERLAEVYSRLMSSASTPEERARWERQGRELLAEIPDADSIDLRIQLDRASYERAERVIAEHRLRVADPAEVELAVRRLTELVDRFAAAATEAHRRVLTLERREDSGRVVEAELLTEALSAARRQRSLGHYLAGWSATNVAQATGAPTAAASGLTHFGWLLNAQPGSPAEIERLPEQFLRLPHVARASIGAAVCESVRGRPDAALAWLDAVGAHPDVAPEIRASLLGRRMEVLASARRWRELLAVVDASTPDDADRPGSGLPTTEARLLAVLALDASGVPASRGRAVEELRDLALSRLIAAGELGHVLDLARRFGAESFGDTTYAARQVRALLAYQRARDAHAESGADTDEPSADGQTAELYRRAAELFETAAASADAADFPDNVGNTVLLIALCHYYAGGEAGAGLAGAAERFERAASELDDPARAADALWMAITALEAAADHASDESGGERDTELDRRRRELAERFVRRFPDHPRASSLVIRLATTDGADPAEAMELLLSVPDTSPLYETARRHASRLGYDRFRGAAERDREFFGRAYLDLAEPLLAIDRRRASAGERSAAERASLRGRRIAEVALSLPVPQIERAERALDAVSSLLASGDLDDERARAEVAYRRALIALSRGDEARAERLFDEIRGSDPELAAAAGRLYFRHWSRTFDRLRRGEPESDRTASAARGVVRYGLELVEPLLASAGGAGDAADRLPVLAAVADAAAHLALRTDDARAAGVALDLYARVLDESPNATSALRGTARVARRHGRPEVALDALRRLVAGLDPGSDEWFAARTDQIELLAESRPGRAAQVLRQHAALHPRLGPEPWRSRLEAVARRLNIDPSAPEPGEGASAS